MNLIRTISTTYSDILYDIDKDSRTSELPYFLKSLIAGIFAILVIRINVSQNQCYIGTVEDRELANQILAVHDYSLKGKKPSEAILTVSIDPSLTTSATYTINTEDLKARSLQDGDTPPFDFEARESLTFAVGESSKDHVFYQQTTIPEVSLNSTTGGNSQEYFTSITDIITETIEIEINGNVYTPVDTFAFSESTDYHFKHMILSDGSSKFLFGFIDEVDAQQFGYIPEEGYPVNLRCSKGGGILGNRPANTITQYSGNDSGVVSVNNALKSSGGSERESIENARNVAVTRIRTHEMFWNEDSGRQLILNNISGLANVSINSASAFYYDITPIPLGGGYPSLSKKQEIEDLLADQFFGQLTITVSDPIYVDYGVITKVELSTGYKLSNIDRYVKLAIWLRAYEQSYYVKEYYNSNGLEQTILLINTLATILSYTYDFDQDANQIRTLLNKLPLVTTQYQIRDRDIDSYLMNNVEGIHYSKTTTPSEMMVDRNKILVPVSIEVSEF